jgi:hypothetical protein
VSGFQLVSVYEYREDDSDAGDTNQTLLFKNRRLIEQVVDSRIEGHHKGFMTPFDLGITVSAAKNKIAVHNRKLERIADKMEEMPEPDEVTWFNWGNDVGELLFSAVQVQDGEKARQIFDLVRRFVFRT